MGRRRDGRLIMADQRPGFDGLDRWLLGGLIAGALLLTVAITAFLVGRHSASTAQPATAATTVASRPASTASTPLNDLTAGKALFHQTCAGCHMQDGTAGGGVGPKLLGLALPRAAIARQIQAGGGAMPEGL
ncbi:MAG: cytochrome c [Thermoleophilia bacterium]